MAKLERACRDGFGAFVPVDLRGDACHAVAVVGYSERSIFVIDPNRPDAVEAVDRERFMARWMGHYIIVRPGTDE